MKFCWHCWHSMSETYRAIMHKVRCKEVKATIDYFEWEEYCCICGKTRTKQSIYNIMLKNLDQITKIY